MKPLIFKKLINYRQAFKYNIFKEVILNDDSNTDWERSLFDIKLHQLDKGDVPCRPIWHYDGSNNPLDTNYVRYMLHLSGDSISRTKFFKDEPLLDRSCLDNEKMIHKFALNLDDKTYKISYNEYNFYTSSNLHIATPALNRGERLLIRGKIYNEH